MRLPNQISVCILLAAAATSVVAFSVNTNGSSSRVFVATPTTTLPKRKVSDCMTSQSLTLLRPDDSVDEAMRILLQRSVSGAPVVDEHHVLVGIVSSFDFLDKEAFEGAVLPMEGSRDQIEKYVHAAQRICGQTVRDVMSDDVKTLTPDVPMRVAAEIMSKEKLHRLPVVDENNRVVGILSAADVMHDLLNIVQTLPHGRNEEESSQPVSP
ncbi:hypothetical protein MPSEU_001089200 [Mayamaea pseudoterrestris]|nr:hypothetical protein MPSEU_001089200 [Mayamaea pseudoterrestris]